MSYNIRMFKEISKGNQKAIDALKAVNLANNGKGVPDLVTDLQDAVQLGRDLDQATAAEAKKNGLTVSDLRTNILVDSDGNMTGITVEQPINKTIKSHR